MRIAILGTPRSGNNWLRGVLVETLKIQPIAVHNYLEAPDPLPASCILNIHWYREPNFQRYLADNGFRVLALARHPLDVLDSVLAFIRHEPLTQRWLDGNVAIPDGLAGCTPASREFLNYATSFGAENLLSVGYQWWQDDSAVRLRYEDLVAEPVKSFGALIAELGGVTDHLEEALEARNLSYFQGLPNRHGWQGRPGLWRDLIPAPAARAIYKRHRIAFEVHGYDFAPRPFLSRRRALSNWKALG